MQYVQGKELKEFMESQSNKMKTNIRMRVTPEQSRKVQKICFDNGITWQNLKNNIGHVNKSLLLIDDIITFTLNEEIFRKHAYQQIDADLFIRTNGTCKETIGSKFQPSDEVIESVAKVNGWDKLETSHYTMNMLLDKLKKKNEILKKARIKRKNQREELHKLNIKLQKCISLEEHNKIVDELKKDINFRNETIKNTLQIGKDRLKEIEQLKAEIEFKNEIIKELEDLNRILKQDGAIKDLSISIVEEQNKEIEKLKTVIEYLESKLK